MTKGTGIRQYRACIRCRARKSRCDFGETGKPPCAKCVREGIDDCILAGSRRGGNYSHLRRSKKKKDSPTETSQPSQTPTSPPDASPVDVPLPHRRADSVHQRHLQNPSDALLILANTCGQQQLQEEADAFSPPSIADGKGLHSGGGVVSGGVRSDRPLTLLTPSLPSDISSPGGDHPRLNTGDNVYDYPPVRDGILDVALIGHILRHYSDNYHPFFPIVPANVLQPACLAETMKKETFLLTAVLSVASRDRPDLADVHSWIWKFMRHLILELMIGPSPTRNVGCVEGLLLLGEWSPVDDSVGGEGTAWSLIGLAVRLAYLLRLEDSSFRCSDGDLAPVMLRRRLTWTFTYLLDRQISIRMGQAFWCRGPSLSARFTAEDFPTLQPKHAYDDDFASFLQAQVEITALFGNAHDILFASKQRTRELMARGDYPKYIDDTRRALDVWKGAWEQRPMSSHLKSCLNLMQHYLRLYVTAFAFQAVLSRHSTNGDDAFPHSIMGTPDARHIYEAVDAAEALLTIALEEISPEKHLRYMPARFYLYEVHSAVFLYKAHASGALSSEMHARASGLMRQFIDVLTAASVDSDHIASKYARLLQGLWFQQPTSSALNGNLRELGASETCVDDAFAATAAAHTASDQSTLFEDVGLWQFDYANPVDGWFSMPAVFPWDQSFF
ncbi:hypothetical protein GQ53DRAFT_805380 [Thozetella sp. PMI_491]|nr:hypothetical protein GQ53DRAFT_805380 [Thozetella sp. PMI_491]